METIENEDMNYQNIWDTAKGALGKFIDIQAHIRK